MKKKLVLKSKYQQELTSLLLGVIIGIIVILLIAYNENKSQECDKSIGRVCSIQEVRNYYINKGGVKNDR